MDPVFNFLVITVNKTDKFSSLLKFLLAQKRAVEYDSSELRASGGPVLAAKGTVNHAATDEHRDNPKQRSRSKCLIHDGAEHSTNECRLYLSKPMGEKMALLKEKGACFSCLKYGHRSAIAGERKSAGSMDVKGNIT